MDRTTSKVESREILKQIEQHLSLFYKKLCSGRKQPDFQRSQCGGKLVLSFLRKWSFNQVYIHFLCLCTYMGKHCQLNLLLLQQKKVRLIYLNNSGMKTEQIQVIQIIPLLPSLTFLLVVFDQYTTSNFASEYTLKRTKPNL